MIKDLGICDRVKIHGWVNDLESIWAYNTTLISTSFNEGMPMVIMEALIRGRVVVATDVGGTSEIVQDGFNGFIADAASIESINDSLERWWDAKKEWDIIGERGVKSVIDYLNNTKGFEEIIKTISYD